MTHVIRLRPRKWRLPPGQTKPIPLIDPNRLSQNRAPPPGIVLRFDKIFQIACIECGLESGCDCAGGVATVDVHLREAR